jgi:hypothetical protein
VKGVKAFAWSDLSTWIEASGMDVVDHTGRDLIILLTARKRAAPLIAPSGS